MTGDEELAALQRLYDAVDEALVGWTCDASTDCCRFAITGREPYLWPSEWALVQRALAHRGGRPRALRVLPADGACPLLDAAGRCSVYAARPYGCRTFFCERAQGPERRPPRGRLAELGRAVAALSQAAHPGADGPRALRSWLGVPSGPRRAAGRRGKRAG